MPQDWPVKENKSASTDNSGETDTSFKTFLASGNFFLPADRAATFTRVNGTVS